MASVNIQIPDNQLARVVHALCTEAGVAETMPNAKGVLIAFIKKTVRRVERMEGEKNAIQTVPPPDVDNIAT